MKFFLVLLGVVVLFATAVPAVAGPGDPRLVNGILEWPRAVSNEPFVVVRGDDGVLYYVAIGAARHDASLAAGGRVAVLGLEGRTAHEINALGIGAGESVEAALANLQGARPSPAVAATTPAPTATAPAAPSPNGGAAAIAAPSAKPAPPAPPAAAAPAPSGKSAVAPTSPGSTSPAAAVTPSAPTPSAPLVTAPAPTSPAVTAPAPTSPAVTAPAPTSPAPAVTPPPAGVGAPLIISTPTPSPVRSAAASPPPARRSTVEVTAPAVPASSTDERRWTEISGVVESLVGRTLILRSDEGRVAVDLSALSQNIDRAITPGAQVRVYGVPVEVRFKAMGFFDPGTRP